MNVEGKGPVVIIYRRQMGNRTGQRSGIEMIEPQEKTVLALIALYKNVEMPLGDVLKDKIETLDITRVVRSELVGVKKVNGHGHLPFRSIRHSSVYEIAAQTYGHVHILSPVRQTTREGGE